SYDAPAPTELYTLSLHDALPILALEVTLDGGVTWTAARIRDLATGTDAASTAANGTFRPTDPITPATKARARCSAFTSGNKTVRSEEHTSELQSRFDLVCRLLLE